LTTASARLSTVGKTLRFALTLATEREIRVPVDAKPKNEVGFANMVVWIVAPSESMAVSVTFASMNAPFMSVPKKKPPMALTPPVKVVITSGRAYQNPAAGEYEARWV